MLRVPRQNICFPFLFKNPFPCTYMHVIRYYPMRLYACNTVFYLVRCLVNFVFCFLFVGVLTSLCHSNGHIETMPAREINPFTALTRIQSQFLRTQWSTSNHQRVDMTTPQTAQPSGLVCVLFLISSPIFCLIYFFSASYHHFWIWPITRTNEPFSPLGQKKG